MVVCDGKRVIAAGHLHGLQEGAGQRQGAQHRRHGRHFPGAADHQGPVQPIMKTIIQPTVAGLKFENKEYKGAALRRADDHPRRAARAGIQRPFRRSGNPGGADAPEKRPGRHPGRSGRRKPFRRQPPNGTRTWPAAWCWPPRATRSKYDNGQTDPGPGKGQSRWAWRSSMPARRRLRTAWSAAGGRVLNVCAGGSDAEGGHGQDLRRHLVHHLRRHDLPPRHRLEPQMNAADRLYPGQRFGFSRRRKGHRPAAPVRRTAASRGQLGPPHAANAPLELVRDFEAKRHRA